MFACLFVVLAGSIGFGQGTVELGDWLVVVVGGEREMRDGAVDQAHFGLNDAEQKSRFAMCGVETTCFGDGVMREVKSPQAQCSRAFFEQLCRV